MYSQTYPSGRIVTTSFDGAGRTSGVTGQKTGEANKTYASAVSYTAHGAVSDLQLGNQLWEHTIFNSRLQPTEIGLGTTRTDSSKFKLAYDYGTTNNGNVQSQTITISGGPTLSQTYTYDALNRIKTGVELNGTNTSWKQKFLYDRFGNRTIDSNPDNTTPEHVGPNPAISPANNRIAAAGYGYDFAGNLTSAPGVNTTRTYEYDAENRQTVYKYGTTTEGLYNYDGEGRRVKKFAVTATGPETTFFVYNVLGQVVAEYSSTAAAANGTRYLTSDTLGTPRVITGADGAVESRHDYLPFGEEIGTDVGGRNTNQRYVADNVRQQFTGSERDDETMLDYMKARYYSSKMGRFTSVDPMPIKKRHLLDPRDLNRYAYVANNPLKYIDPDGLEKFIVIVRTYIPRERVTHPPGVGATFKGDHNEKGERVSARTEQRILVETDSKKPNSNNILDYNPSVGTTVRIARGLGSVFGPSEGKADGKSLQANLNRVNDNTVTVNAKGNEADPLVGWYTGQPAISFNFNVTIQSEGADKSATITFSGQHDGFPAYEVEVIRPESGGTSTLVYKHDPDKTGDGLQSLYGSGEYNPENVRTVIDPKKRR
jgi:RHS repeat-associated protein